VDSQVTKAAASGELVLVENRAGLGPEPFTALGNTLQTQMTMERALAWFFAHTPPLAPEDLVAQDEFSYDLLVPYRGLYLSYDTS
jgi:hypothetical protein